MQSKGYTFLIAIIGVSLLVKILLLVITTTIPEKFLFVGDQFEYFMRASALVKGKGYHHYSTFRPPLYPLFLALIFYLFRSIFAAKLIQILLSTFNVFILYLMSKRIFDEKVGLISALIFSLYPNLIFFSHTLWTETLFVFLLVSSIYFLIEFRYTQRNLLLLLSGLTWGLASLTRSLLFYFLPIIFLWFMIFEKGRHKEKIIHFSLFAIITLITIAPWTYRNYLVYRSLLPISTTGGWIFRIGNNPKSVFVPKDDCKDWSFADGKKPFWFSREEVIEERHMYKRGLNFIINNNLLFLKKSLWEGRHFYTLDSFAIRHLRNGWYGKVPLSMIRALTTIIIVSYILVILMGTIGFIYSKNDDNKWLFIILIFIYTLIHSLAFSMSRYRLPLIPFVIIYSSYSFAHLHKIWKNILTFPKIFILIACFTFWIVIWTFDIPLLSDMLLTGGKNFQFKNIP